MDFKLISPAGVRGTLDPNLDTEMIFQDDNCNWVRDPFKAEPVIKWDGCMQFRGGVHVDSWSDARCAGQCILAIRNLAAKKIPHWDEEEQDVTFLGL